MTLAVARPLAAVVATNHAHDPHTQYVFEAATQVEAHLAAHGGYAVAPFLPFDAPHAGPDVSPHLLAQFQLARAAASDARFTLAYFSAHCSVERVRDVTQQYGFRVVENGLSELVYGGRWFMGFWQGQPRHAAGPHFSAATLVMTVGLLTGVLPQLLVAYPTQVVAVIGFRETIVLLPEAHCSHALAHHYPAYRELFLAALVRPVCSLTEGRTPYEAFCDTVERWDVLIQTLHEWHDNNPAIDPIGLVLQYAVTNRDRLTLWQHGARPAGATETQSAQQRVAQTGPANDEA